MSPALRLAHRGDWRRAPENTIAAFRAALAVPGCDGLEFDVRAARNGIPVVIHDETLDRVQRVPGRVETMTTDELNRHGVPTLEQVLFSLPRRAFLDVELKGDPGRGAVDALTAGRGPGLERAIISSFEPDTLRRVARLAPAWPIWLNAMDLSPRTIELAAAIGCRAVSVDWHTIDARSMAAARDAGLEVAAWTVRRRATYRRLARLGVVAICAEAGALDDGAEPPA
jgi:glycerophosphoryl diester phosphodiesterase